MATPTLSVILPNYNHAQYLPSALRAMVEQSARPTELIVIDDGSTDNSVEIIKDFAAQYPFVQFYENETNRGALQSVERGLSLATGSYVYFAAADDEVLPGIFEKSLALLAQHPEAALSCTIADMFEVDTGLNWHLGVGTADSACYLSPRQLVEAEKRGRLLIMANTVIQRRSTLLEVGGFIPELKWHTDFFAINVAAFRYGICYIPEPLARFNIHSKSFYKAGRRDKDAHRAVLERVMELLTSKEFEREGELMREGGTLYQFDLPILSILLRNPRYRRFVTPTFLRKNLWHTAQLLLKPFTPTVVGNLYFKIAGYRARPAKTP